MSASNEIENEILNQYLSSDVWIALYAHEGPERIKDPIPVHEDEDFYPTKFPDDLLSEEELAALDPDAEGLIKPDGQVGPRMKASFTIKDGVASLTDEVSWIDLPVTTVVSLGVWDAEEEGKLLFSGLMTYRYLTTKGKAFRLAPGMLTVAVD